MTHMIFKPYKIIISGIFSATAALIMLYAYTDRLEVFILPVIFSTFLVFRFCDYCNLKNRLLYIVTLAASAVPLIYLTFFTSYDLPIRAWLFMPFGTMGYHGYLLFVVIVACFLLPSAVYYFTHVSYRAPVLLLLLIISFAVNSRREVVVPPIYTALAAGLFFAVMAFCGNDKFKNAVWQVKGSLVLELVVAVACLTFPFAMNADTTFAEMEGIGELGLPDFLMSNSRFSSTTGGREPTERILFHVEAEEPLYLIRQVFGRYDGARWEYPPDDSFLTREYYDWRYKAEHLNYEYLLAAMAYENFDSIEQIKTATIIPNRFGGNSILAPIRAFDVTGLPDGINIIRNMLGEIYVDTGRNLSGYTVSYFSDSFLMDESIQSLAREYQNDEIGFFDSLTELMQTEELDADTALSFLSRSLDAGVYADFVSDDYESEIIKTLAESITDGLSGEYEKARALERYFRNNAFRYNTAYPPANDDIDYFLGEGKTGICGHYATAMTLMARAAGLNARYVEGFFSSELDEQGLYVVREKHSHAWVQVYIPVYGWVTFEPTVAGDIFTGGGRLAYFINRLMQNPVVFALATVSFLLILGAVGYCVHFFILKEIFFRYRVKKSRAGIALLYRRVLKMVRKKHGVENLSAAALSALIFEKYCIDIEPITECFERFVFGSEDVTEKERVTALFVYMDLRKRVRKMKMPGRNLWNQKPTG